MARATQVRDTETDPEADRLDGFPHPRETTRLFGHDRGEAELAEVIAGGRMHHAWVLAGPSGIGKATFAYRAARCLLAGADERRVAQGSLDVPATSVAARQVLSLSHPGLLVLRRPYDHKNKRFTASIPVDEVRRLRSFLGHRASENAWRVVIVDSADDLNVNAANALLKSLEEPPPRMVFLLVSSEPGRLLNTIRSRCRRLEFAPLGEDDVRQAALAAFAASEADPPADDAWPRLVALAQGSVRRLIGLHFAGGLDLSQHIEATLAAFPAVKWGRIHDLADRLSGAANEEKYLIYQELLFDRLAGLVKAAATGDAPPPTLEAARRLIPVGQLASWAAMWETLLSEEAETRALNLDRKAFILATIERLAAAARR